ncbi:hypothetical protein SAMN02745121_01790 [Nannocystis exedens]|uniref:Uncharacterized protein n=1 Tax=Nannocystis exedens TaxID=54 RepID=A0A1I1VQA7_9BACT|nr:hypothetical protein [Nannocystis exedens]PCC72675.1 hypothetical protein NAEX_05758 [Nannocystis exedens]SFD84218.1 hypothetical protein SAMN02745121_01790 [Nannocystis exedens]
MRTYAYALPLSLFLLAPGCATPLCGDSGDCTATDTATTSDATGSTTEDPPGTTTGTASEPTSTSSETDSTATATEGSTSEPGTTADATTSEPGTTADTTTGEPGTTAETTTSEPGTTAESTTGETTGGPLVGDPSTHGEACAPNDGPAVEIEIALAERVCDADWPEDAPLFRIVLYKSVDELQLGDHLLFGDAGFAWYDDGDGTPESTDQGKVVITELTGDGVRGTYEVTLPDDTVLSGAFDSLYCPSGILCG